MPSSVFIDESSLLLQAQVFSNYLVKRSASSHSTKVYKTILQASPAQASSTGVGLLDYALKHPHALPYLDAYLGFFKPTAELRRRVYIMLAVLESEPDYWDYFLPKKRGSLYLMSVGLIGLRSVFRLLAGTIFVKVFLIRRQA